MLNKIYFYYKDYVIDYENLGRQFLSQKEIMYITNLYLSYNK